MLVLAVEPFWGRAFICDLEAQKDVEIETDLVLSEDASAAFFEAESIFLQLKSSRLPSSFQNVVVEVAESQSEPVREAILTAAHTTGFTQAHLVQSNITRLFVAAKAMQELNVPLVAGDRVVVLDVWHSEVFGHRLVVLPCQKRLKIEKYDCVHTTTGESVGEEEFKNLHDRLFFTDLRNAKQPKLTLIAKSSGADEALRFLSSKSAKAVLYDSETDSGCLIKAKTSLSAANGLSIVDAIDASIKLVIGDLSFQIATEFDELPSEWEHALTQDELQHSGKIKVFHQRSGDGDWTLHQVLPLPSLDADTLRLKCSISTGGFCKMQFDAI